MVRSAASICSRVFQPLLINQILKEAGGFGHIRWTKVSFQLFVDEVTYEKAQNEKTDSGTVAAVWLRVRAAADHQRSCKQQSVRCVTERGKNG